MRKHREDPTHQPPPAPLPHLAMPQGRSRYLGLAVSLALHGALLALVVLEGDRLWQRNLAPGTPALFLFQGGGGGGGGNRQAYITQPSPPERAPESPAPPAPVEPPTEPPVELPPPVEEAEVVPPAPEPVDTMPAVATVDSGVPSPSAGTG